jgi:hypothetical protein
MKKNTGMIPLPSLNFQAVNNQYISSMPDTTPIKKEFLHVLLQEIHSSTDYGLHEALEDIYQAVDNQPELLLQLNSACCADTIKQVKLQTLQQLDASLHQYFSTHFPKILASNLLAAHQSENRIHSFTAAIKNCSVSSILYTGLNEHLAAAKKLKSSSEKAIALARVPEFKAHLKVCLADAVQKKRNSAEQQKNKINNLLNDIKATKFLANDAELKKLLAVRSHNIDQMESLVGHRLQLNDFFYSKVKALAGIIESINAGKAFDLSKCIEDFPQAKSAILLSSHQQSLLKKHNQLILVKKNLDAEKFPKIERKIDSIKMHIQAAEEKQAQLERDMDNLSVGHNIIITLKHLFGRGEMQLTRTQMQKKYSMLQNHVEGMKRELNIISTEKIELINHANCDMIEFEYGIQFFEKKILKTTFLLAEELSDFQQKITDRHKKELSRAYSEEQSVEEQGNKILLRLAQIYSENKLLEQNCDQFSDDNLFKKISSILKQETEFCKLEDLRSQFYTAEKFAHTDEVSKTLENTIAACTEVESIPSYMICETDWLDAKLSDITTIAKRFDFPQPVLAQEVTTFLCQAAGLYVDSCREKIENHPLSPRISLVSQITPRTLQLINDLKDQLKKKPVQQMKYSNLSGKIDGLERIVKLEHSKALEVQSDFTLQHYHAETGLYLDKQVEHGTCVLHSWNNLAAYLTGNGAMMMTPWRIEKFIHSFVTENAYKQLTDMMAAPLATIKPSIVSKVIDSIIRSSGLVMPCKFNSYLSEGYVMSFTENENGIAKIGSNNLNWASNNFFEFLGIASETLTNFCFGRKQSAEQWSLQLCTLQQNDFDAFLLIFRAEDTPWHALSLVKVDLNYQLLDPNYEDPLEVTLKGLTTYFIEGKSDDVTLDDKLISRGYDKYSALSFARGFYKGNASCNV